MALTATTYHFKITLSDVDRGVYEALDLRLARHPSESLRYLATRTLAYCLCYEEGIAFSKGGLSATDEPPVSVRDATGRWLAWIDVGKPSADRLHKAAKLAQRVAVFTHVELAELRRDTSERAVHRADEIEVVRLPLALLEALEAKLERNVAFEVVHTSGQLYVTFDGAPLEGEIGREFLGERG
jgi:uncharacterized protein YaeQ